MAKWGGKESDSEFWWRNLENVHLLRKHR
jgi:hypothetical protein